MARAFTFTFTLQMDMCCKTCFYKHRTNSEWTGCPHDDEEKISVSWNEERGVAETTAASIRPFPANFSRRIYGVGMCNPHKFNCPGDKCTYAHGPEERSQWNYILHHGTYIIIIDP